MLFMRIILALAFCASFIFGVLKSSIRHFTHLRQRAAFTKKTQINETQRHKIDKEAKSAERSL